MPIIVSERGIWLVVDRYITYGTIHSHHNLHAHEQSLKPVRARIRIIDVLELEFECNILGKDYFGLIFTLCSNPSTSTVFCYAVVVVVAVVVVSVGIVVVVVVVVVVVSVVFVVGSVDVVIVVVAMMVYIVI